MFFSKAKSIERVLLEYTYIAKESESDKFIELFNQVSEDNDSFLFARILQSTWIENAKQIHNFKNILSIYDNDIIQVSCPSIFYCTLILCTVCEFSDGISVVYGIHL